MIPVEDYAPWTCPSCTRVHKDTDFVRSEFLCECGFVLLGSIEEMDNAGTVLNAEIWSAACLWYGGFSALDIYEEEPRDSAYDDHIDAQGSALEERIISTKVLPDDFKKFLLDSGWLFTQGRLRDSDLEVTFVWVRIDRCIHITEKSWRAQLPEFAAKVDAERGLT